MKCSQGRFEKARAKNEHQRTESAYSSSRLRRLFNWLERPTIVLTSDSEENRLRDLQSGYFVSKWLAYRFGHMSCIFLEISFLWAAR